MSQITVVWRVVGPLLLGQPVVAATWAGIKTALRLLLAAGAAVGSYVLTMLVVIELYPSDGSQAWLVYAGGMALATWLGACAGALSARRSQQRQVANGAAALAMIVPVVVAFRGGAAGQGQAAILLYILASGVGGMLALRLLLSTAPRRPAMAA